MEPDWTEGYYEALEFFFWEPQHIGRKKHKSATFDTPEKVRRHLRRMEMTLNQLLSEFFLLAPSALRNALFEQVFAQRFVHAFTLFARDVDSEFTLENATQPDLLFVSRADVVAIEMKVDAKCSLEQVLKYALLGLAVELETGESKAHHLGLLGHGSFARQWHEHFASVAELERAIAERDLDAFLSTQASRYEPHRQHFAQIVSGMRFAYLDYADLAEFLRQAAPPAEDDSAGAEVYRKLIAGVVAELLRRRLAT